jgi:hypothetical protein
LLARVQCRGFCHANAEENVITAWYRGGEMIPVCINSFVVAIFNTIFLPPLLPHPLPPFLPPPVT